MDDILDVVRNIGYEPIPKSNSTITATSKELLISEVIRFLHSNGYEVIKPVER